MDINKYKNLCKNKFNEFKDKILPMELLPSGISLTEGFSFCIMGEYFKIDTIIESGTARGMSTEIFARYFNFPIITIDDTNTYGIEVFNKTKNRLSKYDNITCLKGDGIEIIPNIINNITDKKIGIFLDGPKGKRGVEFGKRCFNYKNVIFVGLHDMCYNDSSYHLMDDWDKKFLYTDDEWFDQFEYIDGDTVQFGIGYAENI